MNERADRDMMLELQLGALPEGAVVLRAIACIEYLSADGERILTRRTTPDMVAWDALGLARAAADVWSQETLDGWRPTNDPEAP